LPNALETKHEVGRQGLQQDKQKLLEVIQKCSVAPSLDAREKALPGAKKLLGKAVTLYENIKRKP
jgi:hypothetical protein